MNLNPYVYSQKLIQKTELKTFNNIDSFKVMQKAAEECFKYIIDNIKFQKILVICGPGNNGGDGILIAKHLLDKQKNVIIYAPIGIGKTKDSKKALLLLDSDYLIKEKINIESEYIPKSSIEYKILDSNGRLFYERSTRYDSNINEEIELKNIKSGFIFLIILEGDRLLQVRKIIIDK